MDTGPNARRGQGGFPVDRPMEALKADHQLVRQLFDRYFHAPDTEAKTRIGPDILLLLEMHTSLEEGVFYPRVRDADPSLVAQCENEHEQAKELMERLKGMDEADPQTDQTFRQLADVVFKHIDHEETRLFPRVRQANLDLPAIGLEMQAFEAGMIAAPDQASGSPGVRQ